MNYVAFGIIVVAGILTVIKTRIDIKRSKREVLRMESIYYLEVLQNKRVNDLILDETAMRARLIEIENELETLK